MKWQNTGRRLLGSTVDIWSRYNVSHEAMNCCLLFAVYQKMVDSKITYSDIAGDVDVVDHRFVVAMSLTLVSVPVFESHEHTHTHRTLLVDEHFAAMQTICATSN